MSKLVIYKDTTFWTEFPLSRERVTIGRKPHNDLQLDHVSISSNHALIISVRNDSFLEDLKSTNGTRVNQKLVNKCALQDGDEIRIGKFQLQYVFEAAVPMPQISARAPREEASVFHSYSAVEVTTQSRRAKRKEELTTTIQTDYKNTKTGMLPDSALPGLGIIAPPAGLQILDGPGSGNEINLERILTTLGKPGVQMAVITRRAQGYYLSHVEGGELPLINGKPVAIHSSRLLNARDIIELAGTKMAFYLK